MEPKFSDAVGRVRQLCCAGLPGRVLMPLVIAEIRRSVPAACGQFTWCSETGRQTNFWSDNFIPRRTAWVILNHRRYEADAGVRFSDLVRFGQPTGNLRRWWREGFERSTTFAAVFAPYGYKWFLDGVVRDARRPYGCIALIRRHDEPDFSTTEEALLARLLPYVAHALGTEAARPARFVRSGRSALMVCSPDGEVLEASEAAWRLAVFALVEQINLDLEVDAGGFDQARCALRRIVRQLAQCLQSDGPMDGMPVHVCRNGWGEFVFRSYRLEGGDGAADRIGVLIEQLRPLDAHLLERINATALTLRQKQIALLSAQGVANNQIARQLGISPHTLKDHLKELYARLQVSSHRELLQRLDADTAALAA